MSDSTQPTGPSAEQQTALGDLALNAAHIALFAMRQQKPQEALGVLDDVADSLLQYLTKTLDWPQDARAGAKKRVTETLQLALAVTKGAKL